ncbi:MAG: head-tail connector protein [Acetobacteraceae bacterium]|nr:head-tail connector protein [Acetobacteraceae bacterium]
MSDDLARDVIRRHDRMRGDRSLMEPLWQEIAELVKPMRADFTVTRTPGQRRGLRVFDGTPGYAAENLAAGLWGMVTNSANEWFSLKHPDEALNRQGEVKQWTDATGAAMREAFSAGGQRFYAAALELYADLVAFGTGIFYVDEGRQPGRLFFSNRPLRECCIAQDDEERVDTVYRRFEWTAHQAYSRWGEGAGKSVLKALRDDQPDACFWFLHAVEPNERVDPRRRDARGKAFRSVHVAESDMEVLQAGGYDEFPYMVPRWSTSTGGLYGDSPAMLALPDIKTLQAQEKTTLVAAQKAADPPLLAPDENALRSVRVTPGGITYGAVDANGRPLVVPLQSGGNFSLTLEMAEQKRQAIRVAFYATLLNMQAVPNETATAVLARQEEQLRLMGPHLGRLQAEFHDPLISRVFGLMWRGQAFGQPPDVLRQAPQIAVEYVSPLAKAQKSSEAASIMRTMEAVGPLMQVDPSIIGNFDLDEVARGIADGFAMPARMLRDPEAVKRQREAQQQQAEQAAQMQALAASAQPMAQASRGVRDLAEASRVAEGMGV